MLFLFCETLKIIFSSFPKHRFLVFKIVRTSLLLRNHEIRHITGMDLEKILNLIKNQNLIILALLAHISLC